MFNLSAGELVVLGLLLMIVLSPNKLSDLGAALGAHVRENRPAPLAPRWSWSDWCLVIAALASGAVALALLTGARP